MNRLYAFDMDGVLAEGPPAREKKWSQMNGPERNHALDQAVVWYRNAGQLFVPEVEGFHVITARKDRPDVRAVTEQWLADRFGARILGVHMLSGSRTIEKVSEFKSETLLKIGATDFHEDNVAVVRAMRKILRGRVRVWLYAEGKLSL